MKKAARLPIAPRLRIGARVEILHCTHYDVKPGMDGEITDWKETGYVVKVTGKFAIDPQATQFKTSTEEVYVEVDGVKELERIQ